MKNLKKLITFGIVSTALLANSLTAFAASSYKTPVDAVAELTGKTVDDILVEREEEGKTCFQIAEDAGKLEEFQKIVKDNDWGICNENHIDCPNPGNQEGCLYSHNKEYSSERKTSHGHGHHRASGRGHGHGGCRR